MCTSGDDFLALIDEPFHQYPYRSRVHAQHCRNGHILLSNGLEFWYRRRTGSQNYPQEIYPACFMEKLTGLLDTLDIPKTVAVLKSADVDQIAQRAIDEAFGQYPVPLELNHTQCREILLSLLPN